MAVVYVRMQPFANNYYEICIGICLCVISERCQCLVVFICLCLVIRCVGHVIKPSCPVKIFVEG